MGLGLLSDGLLVGVNLSGQLGQIRQDPGGLLHQLRPFGHGPCAVLHGLGHLSRIFLDPVGKPLNLAKLSPDQPRQLHNLIGNLAKPLALGSRSIGL